MKPLLMMRTNGLTGPSFAKHFGIRGLAKSVGNAVGARISAIKVPNVVGLGQVAADDVITAAGLQSAKVGTIDPVVSQDPIAGTPVGTGSDVTFTLAG